MSDGLMDIIVMEPFDMLEAPMVCFDIMNKTLPKNAKIKTFKAKKMVVHRQAPGVIHYDGDPVMEDKDLTIELREKGIRIVVNPHGDKEKRKPTALQSNVSDIMGELSSVRDDITQRSAKILEDIKNTFGL